MRKKREIEKRGKMGRSRKPIHPTRKKRWPRRWYASPDFVAEDSGRERAGADAEGARRGPPQGAGGGGRAVGGGGGGRHWGGGGGRRGGGGGGDRRGTQRRDRGREREELK